MSLEKLLHDAPILGQQAGMVHAHAAQQQLPQFRPGALRPFVTLQFLGEPGLLAVAHDPLALDLLGHRPALVAIEAEDQGRRAAGRVVALGHGLDLLAQEHVGHPVEIQRHLPLFALDQFQLPLVAVAKPVDEFHGVAHGRRQEQRADLRRQQSRATAPRRCPAPDR